MNHDTLTIGPVPAEESCQQVGTSTYDPVAAKQECKRFLDLIRQTFGDEPEGAHLRIKSNAHDFGSYYEVAVSFDADNEEAVRYAYAVEADAPGTWDDTKKREWKEATV